MYDHLVGRKLPDWLQDDTRHRASKVGRSDTVSSRQDMLVPAMCTKSQPSCVQWTVPGQCGPRQAPQSRLQRGGCPPFGGRIDVPAEVHIDPKPSTARRRDVTWCTRLEQACPGRMRLSLRGLTVIVVVTICSPCWVAAQMPLLLSSCSVPFSACSYLSGLCCKYESVWLPQTGRLALGIDRGAEPPAGTAQASATSPAQHVTAAVAAQFMQPSHTPGLRCQPAMYL